MTNERGPLTLEEVLYKLPISISSKTKELVILPNSEREIFQLVEETSEYILPERLLNSEIQIKNGVPGYMSQDEFLSVVREIFFKNKQKSFFEDKLYLIQHMSGHDECLTSSILWDSDNKRWHWSTDESESLRFFPWNIGVIFIYLNKKKKIIFF